MSINRREFVKAGGAAAALATALPRFSFGVQAKDETKKYKTALVGTGWWGTNIVREAIQSGACQIVAVADVDTRQVESSKKVIAGLTADSPKVYKDYRELLDREKPEIVIVATPDHWHPLIAIAAMKAGAHVYVEKPICHTINEGRAMVQAARDSDRVCQVGTHRRVSPHNIAGMKFLKEGRAGKIGMVRAFVHYPGGKGEKVADAEPPKELDWDMWCGPAPLCHYNPKMHPKGFRMFLDYANGQLGDWGIHWMDQILWWTEEKYPKKVNSFGARHILEDNTNSPDTQVATFEFESFTATWEHRLYAGNEAEKHNLGCYFYGTEGTFHMGWLDGWTFYPWDSKKSVITYPAQLHEPDQQNIRELFADFLAAIKEKRRSVCDIEIGHRSTTMSLLGMLSMKLGRSVEWDGEKQVIVGDDAANKLLRRDYRAPYVYPWPSTV